VAPLTEGEELQARVWSINLGAPIYADPVIHRGSFYVAAGNQLFACTLSDFAEPSMVERWRFNFRERVPVSALLPVDDSLYVTLAHDPQYQYGSMVRLDGISGAAQPREVELHNGWMPSPAAASSDGKAVFFLAAGTMGLYCGMVSHRGGEPVGEWRHVGNAPSPMDPLHPIAVRGGKIFAVFKQRQTLYRIDAESAWIDNMIAQDARKFSLSANGNVLVVTPGNVVIPTRNLGKEILPGYIVSSQPLLLGDAAAVMGMGGGSVWILDMANPARFREWPVRGAGGGITALAPYGDLLAVGDANGAVTIARFNVS